MVFSNSYFSRERFIYSDATNATRLSFLEEKGGIAVNAALKKDRVPTLKATGWRL